jgi:predicted trehalose synthase
LEAVQSAGADAIQKANSLAEARSHLRARWDLLEGTPDSEAVEEMVNVLQIALCVESPEALAPRQLVAIHSVLAKMCDDPDFGDEAANDLTQELIEGGVDVFREIG